MKWNLPQRLPDAVSSATFIRILNVPETFFEQQSGGQPFVSFFLIVTLLLQDYAYPKEMSEQLVQSPEVVAPGPLERAGIHRNSPETEQPQNFQSQVPPQLAKVATALSGDIHPLPPDEGPPHETERAKIGIGKVASAQGNPPAGKDPLDLCTLKNAPCAGNAAPANIAPCKIAPLQSAVGPANQSLGKSLVEPNNTNTGWVNMSQSTVVLGTDGIASVRPGTGTEVSWSSHPMYPTRCLSECKQGLLTHGRTLTPEMSTPPASLNH